MGTSAVNRRMDNILSHGDHVSYFTLQDVSKSITELFMVLSIHLLMCLCYQRSLTIWRNCIWLATSIFVFHKFSAFYLPGFLNTILYASLPLKYGTKNIIHLEPCRFIYTPPISCTSESFLRVLILKRRFTQSRNPLQTWSRGSRCLSLPSTCPLS
jgi:hypothetical protein